MNLVHGLEDAWGTIITFVPRLIAFLVILIVGWIIAKVIKALVTKGLTKAGFDRLLDRDGMRRMMERSDYTASQFVGLLLYYAVGLIVLTIAFSVFGPNPISNLLSSVVAWLPRAAVALVILVVAVAIGTAVRNLIANALSGLAYGPFIGTLGSVFVIALGVIAALNQIGVATTVTGPVLIAVLATVGGILVVGVGGGLVRPMQRRWEHWLEIAGHETSRMRNGGNASYDRGRTDAMSAPSGTTTSAGSGETAERGAQRPASSGSASPGREQGFGRPES